MTRILLSAALFLVSTDAGATIRCYEYNRATYCHDDRTGKTLVCRTVGKQTVCEER